MPITVNGMDELRALVGTTIGPSDWREVTQELIDQFAEVSGDHQWIHVDAERASAREPVRHDDRPRQPHALADRRLPALAGRVDRLQARRQLRLEQGPLPGAGPGRQPRAREHGDGRRRRRRRRLAPAGAALDGRGRGRREAGLRGRVGRSRVRLSDPRPARRRRPPTRISSNGGWKPASRIESRSSVAACPTRPASTSSAARSRKVLYVGKARSLRKRVAGHFSKPGGARGSVDMVVRRSRTSSSSRPRPRPRRCWPSRSSSSATGPLFNVQLRDDKSYPYIAISLDEDYPRIYFTRERHRSRPRLLRPVLERQARARDARPARQGLPVPHLRRAASPAAPPAAPASTTTSSAARPPASATSPRRSTARTSTRSSTSSPAATARSSASSSSR